MPYFFKAHSPLALLALHHTFATQPILFPDMNVITSGPLSPIVSASPTTRNFDRVSKMSRAPSTLSRVASSTGTVAEQSYTYHDRYYIPSGDVVFLVENTLFRVHRYFFVRESAVFRDALSMPSTTTSDAEGSSDTNPIRLPQVTALELSRFLWVFYNPKYSVYEATWDEWASILRLAHIWQFDEIYNLAVTHLDKLTIPPVEKAILATEYNVGRNWLAQAYAALGARDKPLSVSEAKRLGMEVVTLLAEVRERIRTRKHQDEIEVLSAGGRTRPGSPFMGGFTLPMNLSGTFKPVSPDSSPKSVQAPLPPVPTEKFPTITMTAPEYTKDDLEDVKAVFNLSD